MVEIQDIDLKELIEREIGEHFNRQGYIRCPFHNEKTPSLSVKFFPDANKERFKCWGCSEKGDAIDFIMKLKNFDYTEAREYLGLPVEKNGQEQQAEKIKSYIEWQIEKCDFRKGQKLLGLFEFANGKNEVVYYKAKFLKSDGKKDLSYYHVEDDKVINKRGTDELIYNYYSVLEGIKDNKIVIICEGEKDANKLNSMLKKDKYVATSIKGCKDLTILEGAKIYVCSDTGEAGEKYKWHIYNELFACAKAFKFINLPGIKNLGDNKDVTDWLDAGHDKFDLLKAFGRSLDLKNKYELQQDREGIYKIVRKVKKDDVEENRINITNFRLIKATRISFEDEEQEGVKLVLKSPTGNVIEKIGSSTVFDDLKSFRNFLGTIDLSFSGNMDNLVELKSWINNYFALEVEEIHQGVKFKEKNEELLFITNDGAIGKNGTTETIKADKRNNADVIGIEPISAEELKKLKNHILRFATPEKTISIIGTIINDLAIYQNQKMKEKLHHLLIVGESGSGKSTILENVIAPILNYPKRDIKSIGLITPFALIKGLSDGNYPMLFDEFKPSSLDRYKVAKLSETLRNLYDRATISRGDKSFKSKDFQLNRPLVLVGEESYPNQEKALIERSCIVYLSRREREEKHTEAMEWIIANEEILNKFGRSLIDTILNLNVDEYREIRKSAKQSIKGLSNRPLNTALNICCGIEIFNILFKKHNLKPITKYEDHVIKNIETEILDGGADAHSTVEQMLILYNDIVEDKRAEGINAVECRGDGVFIKTSEMLNQIRVHIRNTSLGINILDSKDFKKQAAKAGYLEGLSNKLIKVDGKPMRFDTYNKKMLLNLKVYGIVPPDALDVTDMEGESNIIPFR
ncbi:CHC2 zinc finger domain-containing protein [Clostridium pasteurianum]|uniref:CHC2 zinc finger domain-containing protein n=1 Tax=Clostridium pasteurianum TaxID=1501 RepID=UPI0003A3D61C|nr:CHC2 zinc finger domain-containing protein [Clostridium pasteurianum]